MPLYQWAIVEGVVWVMEPWCWVLAWTLAEWVIWRVVLEIEVLVISATLLLPEVVGRVGWIVQFCKTKVSEVL
jgi:hypothetical protein